MTKLKDRKFLLVGGVNNSSSKLKVPSAADAYLVEAKTDRKLGVKKVEGLGEGRYFHTTATYDFEHAIIMGGFTSVVQGEDPLFSDAATADFRFFDLTTNKLSLGPIDAQPLPRGGHTCTALATDCLLLVGGVDQVHLGLELDKGVPLLAEVFCPSVLCPEGLWESTCYQE